MNNKVSDIFLAPMEGVVDGTMRRLLTQINDFDLCITEFVRVVDYKLPKHLFYKTCPELKQESCTDNGTPVRVQLLGQHPQWMAENAHLACSLGSRGIDLNFGCPAPTVNKSMGGAILLNSPDSIYRIIIAVKEAVTALEQDVSVKIRLGFNEVNLFREIIAAINQANPAQLTVHARTKRHGYKPPAYWRTIGDVNEINNIKTIANGEIWSKEDAENCMLDAKTKHLMLGRGALALPNLANVIKYNDQPMTWPQVCELLIQYINIIPDEHHRYYVPSRIKQWLKYLKIQYHEAGDFFEEIKRISDKQQLTESIKHQISTR
ncbi:tRNA-dihydrouridine synthase [Thalassotalea atypica]|uniref:tRNA-dihydrouridine synthase n=1 Tax=Thalassotalea atypica TaxID=2054316 RepID=UPI0025722E93|nr:tRNA-dihydrouridine synthase [Thalassotalea atypica]